MKKNKVYIYGDNSSAATCRDWAKNNIPKEFELVDTAEESGIIISVLGEEYFSEEILQNKRAYIYSG